MQFVSGNELDGEQGDCNAIEIQRAHTAPH